MRALKAHISKIRELIDCGNPDNLTYAALEARFAIEFFCYEKLRISHSYISQKDIRRWQPKDIVNILFREVDEHTASTFTLSVGSTPISDNTASQNEPQSAQWTDIGTQIGFDPAKLGRFWQALPSFLHARAAATQSSQTIYYADTEKIRDKVLEVVEELERISDGTLTSSGFGETVPFKCDCGR